MIKSFINAFNNIGYDPSKIDRLITSYYVLVNDIKVKNNELIKSHLIGNDSISDRLLLQQLFTEFKSSKDNKFDLENLIELFELVISPKEKIVTGAVYTPLGIRQFIISKAVKKNNSSYNPYDFPKPLSLNYKK